MTASVTVSNFETIEASSCNPDPPPVTDMVTDLPILITD